MENFDDQVLGESTELIRLVTREQSRAAAVALVRQAVRSVDIMSRHLDATVYDQLAFMEALRRLVLDHRRARVRILVADPNPIIKDGHRFAALALQLSSFMEIRVLSPTDQDFNQAFLILDETGYVYQELADRYEGVACFRDRGQAGELNRQFNRMWEPATHDPNLRQMRL